MNCLVEITKPSGFFSSVCFSSVGGGGGVNYGYKKEKKRNVMVLERMSRKRKKILWLISKMPLQDVKPCPRTLKKCRKALKG